MLLKISKLSKFNKKHWVFKYSNFDFDEIISLILSSMDYDYVELKIWSFQLDLFQNLEYSLLDYDEKYSTLKLDKANSIKILVPNIYEDIRHFKINIYSHDKKFFCLDSENYGEYTSIAMDKTISEDELSKLLDDIFDKN